ncbi:hypothetical protein RB195_010737 [Necator americanus]|uniref:Uncharacterized protein n=1 Tax=Necator americanus TaxID=51031 RepID=A0ABR1CZL0_NECAM
MISRINCNFPVCEGAEAQSDTHSLLSPPARHSIRGGPKSTSLFCSPKLEDVRRLMCARTQSGDQCEVDLQAKYLRTQTGANGDAPAEYYISLEHSTDMSGEVARNAGICGKSWFEFDSG